MTHQEEPPLWVFGYGSLTWKPNIHYRSKSVGYICGFSRKFWQGNTNQRGTIDQPGRVATLIESKEENVWGVAFEVCGTEHIKDALSHLDTREAKLGGYYSFVTRFYPRDSAGGQSINVLCYTATSNNPHYLGPCDTDLMAEQIVMASGTCGTNSEYVLRLAQFIRENIPEDQDTHLFALETNILEKLREILSWTQPIFTKTLIEKGIHNGMLDVTRSIKL